MVVSGSPLPFTVYRPGFLSAIGHRLLAIAPRSSAIGSSWIGGLVVSWGVLRAASSAFALRLSALPIPPRLPIPASPALGNRQSAIGYSVFALRPSFGLRISPFGFPPSPFLPSLPSLPCPLPPPSPSAIGYSPFALRISASPTPPASPAPQSPPPPPAPPGYPPSPPPPPSPSPAPPPPVGDPSARPPAPHPPPSLAA